MPPDRQKPDARPTATPWVVGMGDRVTSRQLPTGTGTGTGKARRDGRHAVFGRRVAAGPSVPVGPSRQLCRSGGGGPLVRGGSGVDGARRQGALVVARTGRRVDQRLQRCALGFDQAVQEKGRPEAADGPPAGRRRARLADGRPHPDARAMGNLPSAEARLAERGELRPPERRSRRPNALALRGPTRDPPRGSRREEPTAYRVSRQSLPAEAPVNERSERSSGSGESTPNPEDSPMPIFAGVDGARPKTPSASSTTWAASLPASRRRMTLPARQSCPRG